MENKTLRAKVYTNELVFSDTAEQPIDVDFTLPDYCLDISKILKCRAISRVSSKAVNGRVINIDGSVAITVIYCSEEGRLSSFEYQYPYAKTFEMSEEYDNVCLYCRTKCEYVNCRAVTNRKIDVHGAVSLHVKALSRRARDVISDIDDSNVELRRGCVPATSPMGNGEKYLLVEEEINLGETQSPITCILRYDADTCVKESKLLAGKAVVKGEMFVSVLCCLQDGNTCVVRKTVPFSQILEIEGVNEDCECEATVKTVFLEIKPKTDSSGENTCLSLNAKLLVSAESYCNNNVDIVLDAYSRKYSAQVDKSDVCFKKICQKIADTFNCKKTMEFDENSISSVNDMWCDCRTDAVNCNEGNLCISGQVTAYIIACNADGIPSFYEKNIEFQYKHPLDTKCGDIKCEPEVSVVSCGYTILSTSNVELRVELSIGATVYECNNISLITDVTLDTEKVLQKNGAGAMTIYFASAGENLWDIAHRYLASMEEIKAINDISDEILLNDKMILVPMQ